MIKLHFDQAAALAEYNNQFQQNVKSHTRRIRVQKIGVRLGYFGITVFTILCATVLRSFFNDPTKIIIPGMAVFLYVFLFLRMPVLKNEVDDTMKEFEKGTPEIKCVSAMKQYRPVVTYYYKFRFGIDRGESDLDVPVLICEEMKARRATELRADEMDSYPLFSANLTLKRSKDAECPILDINAGTLTIPRKMTLREAVEGCTWRYSAENGFEGPVEII